MMHASIHDISIHKFFNERQDRVKNNMDDDHKKAEKIEDIRIYKKSTHIKPMDTTRKIEILQKMSQMASKSRKDNSQ